MIFLIVRLAILLGFGYIVYRVVQYLFSEVLSDTKRCPRCEGKGWWQNTRNRETCEWCEGSGRLAKDFPVD